MTKPPRTASGQPEHLLPSLEAPALPCRSMKMALSCKLALDQAGQASSFFVDGAV